MLNYFYTDEISEVLAQLMNEHISNEQVKRIYRGDFTVLPTPEQLDECLPAIIIESIDADHEFANESLGVLYSQYKYRIFYVQPYTYLEGEQVVYNTTKAIEKIANILLYSNTLSLVLYSQYKYRIFYVQPYTYLEGEQVVYNTTKAIEKIANILLYSNTLSLEVEPSETQKGGLVIHTEIKKTSLAPIEEEGVLSLAGVEVAIGALEAIVHFRTFE